MDRNRQNVNMRCLLHTIVKMTINRQIWQVCPQRLLFRSFEILAVLNMLALSLESILHQDLNLRAYLVYEKVSIFMKEFCLKFIA